MIQTLLDRLLVFLVLELAQLMLMLAVAESPVGTLVTPGGMALLIGLGTVLLGTCAWLPWFAARSGRVVKTFGAVLLVCSVLLSFSDRARTAAGTVPLACLGLILALDGMGRVRRHGPAKQPAG